MPTGEITCEEEQQQVTSKGVPLPWFRAVFEKALYGLHRVSSPGLQQGLRLHNCKD